MSNRPIQDQLETRSRIAFESSLPASWVFRLIKPDWGLDGLVEVFTPEGHATGDFFFVQFKATEPEDVNTALKIRLPQAKCDYYDALALPLFLVYFHGPSKRLFGKWFTLPPIKERCKNDKSVVFDLKDAEWTDNMANNIAAELHGMRNIKHLLQREKRIKKYCDAKSRINLVEPAELEESDYILQLETGNIVIHNAFGRGIIESASEYYFFVDFDDDETTRKFYPGDSREFVKLNPAG